MSSQKTPRKKNHRHNNSQTHIPSIPIQTSDYESEAYVPATVENRSSEQINFTVLRRYIPALQSIISIASSTQIYTFSPETQTWEKTNTEGTLFVCELAASPLTGAAQHAIVVLNRRGLDNLIIETREVENVEITEQFLFVTLRSLGELKTLGFFIYEDNSGAKGYNCQLIMELWERAMKERERESELVGRLGLKGEEGQEMVRGLSMSGQKPMGRRLSLTELFGQQR